ncbi:MAG: hypothetical protein V2A64_00545 [Candidatus Omnitrophota bacterium]
MYTNNQEFSLCGKVRIELIRAAFAKGAFFRFTAKGFSMFPFIRSNDVITLVPLSLSPVEIGKAVAYVCPVHNKLIVHRVIDRKKGCYLIKGDNVPKPDCLIAKEHILGCVTAIQRNNKAVFLSLGPERAIIAFLSRTGMLRLILWLLRLIIPKPLRRFIRCRTCL